MRRFFLCVVWLFLMVGIVAAQEPSLGELEREYLLEAIKGLNISQQDLRFEKKWATDTLYRLEVVERLMDDPLLVPDYTDSSSRVVEHLGSNASGLLVFEATEIGLNLTRKDRGKLEGEIKGGAKGVLPTLGSIPETSPELGLALAYLLTSLEVGERHLEKALKPLTKSELDKLLMEAPVMWSDDEDSTDDWLKGELHREFGADIDTSIEVESDTLLEISRKIDRKSLTLAGLSVCVGAELARKELLRVDLPSLEDAELLKVEGVRGGVLYYCETAWGKVVVGGSENNEYKGDFAIILDISGDDVYRGRVGGAVGVLGNPFSVLIDLSGNDLYDSDKLFNLGSAIFGAGVLMDGSGDDIYRGFHYAHGAGLYGTGVLIDEEGEDLYQGGYFAQGAGNFGLGVLYDGGGNDTYKSHNWAQGFGSVFGYGLLSDFGGCDIYYAGGRYIHHPLLPEDYRSFAQGFGMGWRPIAGGGIGFLYDREGNDFYNAEVYAQGTSYWYSLGMLVDESGNDHYLAAEYAQGAGIHLSVGILIDRDGEDSYFSKYGPGQGEGHDFAVGFLIDKKGRDSYHISGGQGIGLTNSVGVFIDSEGDDSYSTTEKIGQGSGTWARGFGGAGIFLDLDGKDTYPKVSPGEDRTYWSQRTYGAGIDLKEAEKPEEEEEEVTEEDTVKRPVEEVFEEASLWEVREYKPRVRKARKELIDLGMEAVDYVCKEKMATRSGLALRAIQELAEAMPDSILPCLLKTLRDERVRARANAIWLLGKMKAEEAVDSLLLALKSKDNKPRWTISALGEIGETRIVPEIVPYLRDRDETTRITAASALSQLKDPQAIPSLIDALGDDYFTVRSAAEKAIVETGDTTVVHLLEALRKEKHETAVPHIIRALGSVAGELDTLEAREQRILIRRALIPFLDREDPTLRGFAVEAIGKIGGEVTKSLLERKMEDELDEFVLGRYRQALQK